MSIRTAERTLPTPPLLRERRRATPDVSVGFVALLGLGLVLRAWVLVSPIGAFDSDSAVPALMARHLLEGEFATFYWGQPYGGSFEAFAAAALFTVLPPLVLLVKLVPMAFCAAATVLTWLVGRRLVGKRAAALGAAFFWVLPFPVWYSSKTGPYWASLVATLLCVLLLLRIADARRPARWDVGLLGLCLGLAWWGNPSLLLVVPVVALLLARRLASQWRLWWLVVAGFALGAAPWLVFNLGHGFMSLKVAAGQPRSTYAERLEGFFTTALPMTLGLRRPFAHEWLLGPVGQLLYAAGLVAFAVFVARSLVDRRRRLLCAVAVVYPFLYALSPYTWYLGQPRYLLFLLPFLALLAGKAAEAPRRAWAGIGLSAAVAVLSIGLFPAHQPSAAGAEVPPGTSGAHRLLRQNRISHAYADYWIAYRLTFESGKRTIVAPVSLWRYQPYQDQVAASDRPAYVFLQESPTYRRFLAGAADRSVPVDIFRDGRWAVVAPLTRVLPADWPEVFGCPDQCVSSWSAWRPPVRSPRA